jgi:hypothetical protein
MHDASMEAGTALVIEQETPRISAAQNPPVARNREVALTEILIDFALLSGPPPARKCPAVRTGGN